MKRLNLFLILCFLSVQMFASEHMAEFGFKKHSHHGQVCDFFLHYEHNTGVAPDTAALAPTAQVAYEPVASLKDFAVVASLYQAPSPRAPPALS